MHTLHRSIVLFAFLNVLRHFVHQPIHLFALFIQIVYWQLLFVQLLHHFLPFLLQLIINVFQSWQTFLTQVFLLFFLFVLLQLTRFEFRLWWSKLIWIHTLLSHFVQKLTAYFLEWTYKRQCFDLPIFNNTILKHFCSISSVWWSSSSTGFPSWKYGWPDWNYYHSTYFPPTSWNHWYW